MKKEIKTDILKCFFAAIGIIIALAAIVMFFMSNINLGLFLSLFLGLSIAALALMPKKVTDKIPKWVKIGFIVSICIFIVFSSFLIIYGINDSADYSEDAVIVLGAAVRGKTPSATLQGRLNKAVEYYSKNPNAIIVVSGGKGPQEDITEAEAMEKYLIAKGVPKDKIIKEEKADSTYTNFKYSKEILDNKLGKNYKVTFITNEFHVFRSYLTAKDIGFKHVTSYHSSTKLSYIISGVSRECIAVLKYLIF